MSLTAMRLSFVISSAMLGFLGELTKGTGARPT